MSINKEKVSYLLGKILCGYELLRDDKDLSIDLARSESGLVWDITIEMPLDSNFGHDSSNNKYLHALIDHFESAGYEVGKFTEVEVPAEKIWEI